MHSSNLSFVYLRCGLVDGEDAQGEVAETGEANVVHTPVGHVHALEAPEMRIICNRINEIVFELPKPFFLDI